MWLLTICDSSAHLLSQQLISFPSCWNRYSPCCRRNTMLLAVRGINKSGECFRNLLVFLYFLGHNTYIKVWCPLKRYGLYLSFQGHLKTLRQGGTSVLLKFPRHVFKNCCSVLGWTWVSELYWTGILYSSWWLEIKHTDIRKQTHEPISWPFNMGISYLCWFLNVRIFFKKLSD